MICAADERMARACSMVQTSCSERSGCALSGEVSIAHSASAVGYPKPVQAMNRSSCASGSG